ncbi:hypothetical protein BD413DRAFT_655216 [Trametes elegans]|nr:hypothetical protein BD413DRAFT_655216 [Trametes elegans]
MATTPATFLATSMATLVVHSVLWGIFSTFGCTSIFLLLRKAREDHRDRMLGALVRSPLFMATVILMCTVTTHWAIIVARLFVAFFQFKGGAAPFEYLATPSQPTEVALTALNVASVVICDLMVITRTWIIWGKDNRVVIFPLISTVGLTTCSISIIYQYSRYTSGEDIYSSALGRWITGGYVLTLTSDRRSAGMIAYRILSTSRAMRRGATAGGRSVIEALSIFIESAALYAVWVVFFFIAYQTKWSVNVLANDCLPPISGISLMLITLRISLGWTRSSGPTVPSPPSMDATSTGRGGPVFARGVQGERPQDVYPLHAISLNVTKTVEQETDYGLSARDLKDIKNTTEFADV